MKAGKKKRRLRWRRPGGEKKRRYREFPGSRRRPLDANAVYLIQKWAWEGLKPTEIGKILGRDRQQVEEVLKIPPTKEMEEKIRRYGWKRCGA